MCKEDQKYRNIVEKAIQKPKKGIEALTSKDWYVEWRPRSQNNFFDDLPKTKAGVVWNRGGGSVKQNVSVARSDKNLGSPTSYLTIPGLPSLQRGLQTKTERIWAGCKKLYFTKSGKQMTLVTTLQSWSPGWQICFAEKSVSEHRRAHLANGLETWNKQLSGLVPGQGQNEMNTGLA